MNPASNTDQLGPPNAATKVFSTFELLENILVLVSNANLPHKDENYISRAPKLRLLYPLQRVNKTSRNVINRSKTLRGHMFKDVNDNEDVPLLGLEWKRARSILNPFAVVMYCLVPLGHMSFHVTSLSPDTMYLEGRAVSLAGSAGLEEAKQLPHCASWRQMLISCKSVAFIVYVTVDVRGVSTTFDGFKLEKGATLGELADIVISMVGVEDELKGAIGGENLETTARRDRQRRGGVCECGTPSEEQHLSGCYDCYEPDYQMSRSSIRFVNATAGN